MYPTSKLVVCASPTPKWGQFDSVVGYQFLWERSSMYEANSRATVNTYEEGFGVKPKVPRISEAVCIGRTESL